MNQMIRINHNVWDIISQWDKSFMILWKRLSSYSRPDDIDYEYLVPKMEKYQDPELEWVNII